MVPMRFEFLSRCRKWVSCLNLPFFDDKVVGDEFHSGTGQGIYSRFYVDDMDFVDTEAIVSQTRRWTLFFSYRERYFLSKGSMLQGLTFPSYLPRVLMFQWVLHTVHVLVVIDANFVKKGPAGFSYVFSGPLRYWISCVLKNLETCYLFVMEEGDGEGRVKQPLSLGCVYCLL
ncbi:hypothetical protein V6N12_020371 [Hibiscus sabdariffa]|uniref:Uncharacterized protein n=1 Tax=Hibiscus sabdariffa TaxID=183260 RepID=A0ABR2B303_9ROSI